MFDFINNFASQGAAVSPWLPFIIKTAVVLVITSVTLLPIMFIVWLVHWASSDAFKRATIELRNWSNRCATIAHDTFQRGTERFDTPSVIDELYIPLDKPRELSWSQDLTALKASVEHLKIKIDEAPDLAANSEAAKAQTLGRLTKSIEMLSKERDSIRVPKIPKISEADATAKLRKQRAVYALFAFIPLTIIAVLINSALLNVFFSELFGRKNIFGIPYSILISSIFSIIEAGVGWTLGMMAVHEKDRQDNSSFVICWAVILCLTIIELILYFLVGTKMFGDLDLEDVFEIFSENNFWLVIISGGWFSLIGPAIVLSLYLFGHKLSIFYFEFHKYSSLDDFRRAMDDGHDKAAQFLANVRDGEKVTSEISEKLNGEELRLNRIIKEQPDNVNLYTKALGDEINKLDKSIECLNALEIQSPETEVQKIGAQQSHELSKVSMIYLVLFFMAVAIGAMALPLSNIPFLSNSPLTGLLLSSFISMVCLMAGLICSPRVSVIRVNESDVARFSFEKKGSLSLVSALIILAGLVSFYWNVFGGVEVGALRASIAIILNIVCFFVGTRLLASFANWVSLVRCIFWIMTASCFMLSRYIIMVVAILLQFIDEVLYISAKPVKTLFGNRYEKT